MKKNYIVGKVYIFFLQVTGDTVTNSGRVPREGGAEHEGGASAVEGGAKPAAADDV